MHINQALAAYDSTYKAALEIIAYQHAIDQLYDINENNVLNSSNLHRLIAYLTEGRDFTPAAYGDAAPADAAPADAAPADAAPADATQTTPEQDARKAAFEEGYHAGLIDGRKAGYAEGRDDAAATVQAALGIEPA